MGRISNLSQVNTVGGGILFRRKNYTTFAYDIKGERDEKIIIGKVHLQTTTSSSESCIIERLYLWRSLSLRLVRDIQCTGRVAQAVQLREEQSAWPRGVGQGRSIYQKMTRGGGVEKF